MTFGPTQMTPVHTLHLNLPLDHCLKPQPTALVMDNLPHCPSAKCNQKLLKEIHVKFGALFFLILFIYLIIFWLCWVFVASLGFSSCGERGLFSSVTLGLPIAVSCLVAERRLWGACTSVVVAPGL